jgi:geranylgeranyl diphosphate synthase, type II
MIPHRSEAFAQPATDGNVMASVLEEYGRATRETLDHYLARERRAPYLDDLMADYPGRGGKMMRPCICIANARAFGGQLEDAVQSAAAIELLHNALLVHDDIQDGSETRRGRPTLHALHGVPLAINAGDAMLLTALSPLLDNLRHVGEGVALRVLEATMTMARETAEGQALELGWRDANEIDLTEADYLTMVLKKTAWMGMIWPAQVGLLIGSRGAADPDSVVRFGFFLGAAFQIEDDVRNLIPDANYGKELNGDLFEAKRTIVLLHARRTCTRDERREVDAFLGLRRTDRTPEGVLWLADLIRRQGSIDYARTVASGLAGAADHEFSLAYGHLPPSRDKSFIAGLTPWLFEHA